MKSGRRSIKCPKCGTPFTTYSSIRDKCHKCVSKSPPKKAWQFRPDPGGYCTADKNKGMPPMVIGHLVP